MLFKISSNCPVLWARVFLGNRRAFVSYRLSTVKHVQGQSYSVLHDEGVRVNEIGIEKYRRKEARRPPSSLLLPGAPLPCKDICEEDFSQEMPCVVQPCSENFHQN